MNARQQDKPLKANDNPEKQVIQRLYELRDTFPKMLDEAVLVISSSLMLAIHEEFFNKTLNQGSYKSGELPKVSKIKINGINQVNFVDCTTKFLVTDEGLSLANFLYVLGSVKRCKFLFIIGHTQAESAGIKPIITLLKSFFSILKQSSDKKLDQICSSVGIIIPNPHENKNEQFYIKKIMGTKENGVYLKGIHEPNFFVYERSSEVLGLARQVIDKQRLVIFDGKNQMSKICKMLEGMRSIDTKETLDLQKITQKITVNGKQVPLQVNYTISYFNQLMQQNIQLLTDPQLGYTMSRQISQHVKKPGKHEEKQTNILVKKPAFIIRNLIRFLGHLTTWVTNLSEIDQKKDTIQFEMKIVKQIYDALIECQMLPKPQEKKRDYVEQYFMGAYDIYSRVTSHFTAKMMEEILENKGIKIYKVVLYQSKNFFQFITKGGKGLLLIEKLLLKLTSLVTEELGRSALASEQYKQNARMLEEYIPIYQKFCLVEEKNITQDFWQKDRKFNNIRKVIPQMRYLYLRYGNNAAEDFKLFFDAAKKSHLLEAGWIEKVYLLLARKLQQKGKFQEAIQCYLQGDKVGSVVEVIRVYESGLKVSLNGLKVISRKDFNDRVKHYMNFSKRLIEYGLNERMRSLVYECISACSKFAIDEEQTEAFKSILLKGGDRWEVSSHCKFLQTELNNRSNEAIKKDLLGKQDFLQKVWNFWK